MLKLLMATALGGAGIALPVVYSISSSNSSSTKFVRKLSDVSEPVLVCTEDSNKEGYEIRLQLDENQEDLEKGLNFHIFRVNGGGSKEEVKKKTNSGWVDFYYFWLSFNGTDKVTKVGTQQINGDTGVKWVNCKNSKIIAKKANERSSYPSQNVNLLHINFHIDKNCSPKDKQECNINIQKSGDNLGWASDFQPKVTYTAL